MKENERFPKKQRQQHSPQFKDQALERASTDGVAQTARDLGIPESMLYA